MNKFELKDFTLEKNYVIEASAGTGKTHNIIGIVEKIVNSKDGLGLGKTIPLERILIVTYTEKAAGELKDRIGDRLVNVDMSNSQIFTIHSFCQNMIKEYAISGNLSLGLNVISENEIYDFGHRYIREGEILKDISKFYNDYRKFNADSLVALFINGINKYYLGLDYEEDKDIVSFESINNARYILDKLSLIYSCNSFEELCDKWPDIYDNYLLFKNSSNDTSNKFATELKNKYIDDDNKVLNYNGKVYKKKAKANKNGPAWPIDSDEIDALEFFKNLKDDLNAYTFNKLMVSLYLKDFYIKWQKEKEQKKSQTFDDMLRNVREKVKHEESFKKKLKEKYDVAIIDEFQDTNQKQFDIFKSIFMGDDEHRIIVVGDPKQSIYSFQGADIFVYYNAVEDITSHNGGKYVLNKNYRSNKNVVKSCNKLFQKYDFGKATFEDCDYLNEEEDDVNKIPLVTYEGKDTTGFWIASDDKNPIDEYKFAKIAVETIVDCCKLDENKHTKLRIKPKDEKFRNVTFKDFVILASKTSEMIEIQKALSRVGIPYTRYKDKKLFIGKECYHWICLLKAIDVIDYTGYNRMKLKKALFTDFFGNSLSKINSDYVNKDSIQEVEHLSRWKEHANLQRWEVLFDDIIINSKLSENKKSLKEIQSLSKYKQIANYCIDYLSNGKTISDLIIHLTNLSNNSGDSDEQNSGIVEKSTDFDCVRIMTSHASKGLQFPVVICCGGFKGKNNKAKLYTRHVGEKQVLSLDNTDDAKADSAAEIKRLFYVAYTRPQYLMILPFYEKTIEKFLSSTLKDYMDDPTCEYRDIYDNNIDESVLKEDVKKILNSKVSNTDKENTDKENTDKEKLIADQTKVLKNLIRDLKYKRTYKHSYSSMSHSKDVEEIVDGELINKEGEETEGLAIFDKTCLAVIPKYDKDVNPIALPKDYPVGAKLGTALHEVFEGLDFPNYEINLDNKINRCFSKQGIKLKDEWLNASKDIVKNVLNAELPIINGKDSIDDTFKLIDISFDNKLDEVEFNFNVLDQRLVNYCNGFVDMIIRRGDYYSIVDWKSDKLNDILTTYSDILDIKPHVDNCYSVQRVLYSYCLIKWLKTSFKDESLEEIFRNHFGGIYYIFLRGCNENTGNGVYCQTWSSWKDLEDAFNNIVKAKIGGK